MSDITQADREAAAAIVYMENKSGLNWASAEGMRDQVAEGRWDWHPAVQAFASHRKAAMDYWYRQGKDDGAEQERAKIVAWLRKENGKCDCFAYEDNECACGGRDEYKIWPLEQTANYLERGEHLK